MGDFVRDDLPQLTHGNPLRLTRNDSPQIFPLCWHEPQAGPFVLKSHPHHHLHPPSPWCHQNFRVTGAVSIQNRATNGIWTCDVSASGQVACTSVPPRKLHAGTWESLIWKEKILSKPQFWVPNVNFRVCNFWWGWRFPIKTIGTAWTFCAPQTKFSKIHTFAGWLVGLQHPLLLTPQKCYNFHQTFQVPKMDVLTHISCM